MCGISRHIRLFALMAIMTVVVIAASAFCPAQARAETAAEVRAKAAQAMSDLDAIQTEINSAQAVYDSATEAQRAASEAMNEAQTRIEDATKRSKAAEKRMKSDQERLKNRAVALYRNGQPTLLDVLLDSSSFEEFATMSSLMDTVNAQDMKLIEDSRVAKAEAEEARAEAEEARAQYEEQKARAEAQMKAAADAKSQLSAKASEMESQVKNLTVEAAALQAQEEASQGEAEAAAAETAVVEEHHFSSYSYYSPTGDVVSGSGQFSHPCPEYTYISSEFGYRDFDSSFHKGVDFAAPQGTPIYAADAGTVLISGYSDSAGNWVVISHGNGLTTKYMHMAQLPFVYAGQGVSKGQNIGVVGTTGYSTGPHLHFQVEVDGTPVNPLYYL